MGGNPGPSSTTLPAGSPPLGPSLSHQLAGLRKLYWGQDMDTQPVAFPGGQHSPQRPGAGLQLASLQLPEESQETTGTQAGGLPACQVPDPTSVRALPEVPGNT